MKGISYFLSGAAVVLFTIVSISSCDKAKTAPVQCPEEISFSGFVEPMIQQNCSTSGCHDAGTSAGTYNLEGHGNISLHAEVILTAIRHEGNVNMPYFQTKLNDSIIEKFDCWVTQGSLNN